MAVKTKEELLSQVNALLGENASDEGLALLEDISDTFGNTTDDWKSKYEQSEKEKTELETSWREKYRSRFMNPEVKDPESEPDNPEEPEPDKSETVSYKDLFTEVGKE